MKGGFIALSALTAATWTFLLVHSAGVLLALAQFRGWSARDLPSILVPALGLAASVWTGFVASRRISRPAAMLIELLLLALGCFFIVVVLASRAG